MMPIKTVIITGANGNLGKVVVAQFLSSGYRVIATVLDDSMLHAFEKNEHLEVYAVNLLSEEGTASFAAQVISKYKTVEGVLMLAGGFAAGDLVKTTEYDLIKMYNPNFVTAYHMAHPFYVHMKEQGYGRLVFVGARPALEAAAGMNAVAYALSKSMVIKLAELLNADAKGLNVTATVIVPSIIDTPANRESMPHAKFDDWVKAEQIAGMMELICSDAGDALRETVLKVYSNS